MFIRKLKPGERAVETADHICIERGDGGRLSWIGSLVLGGKNLSGSGRTDFATVQEAETDAIAWARAHGAEKLQIEGPNT